uniref:NACHT LRR and PYD domain-containing protein n=1 Tax=Amphilophus citrinellus TaxID=61819 RepID=A0A3Q0RCU8_AMPCI
MSIQTIHEITLNIGKLGNSLNILSCCHLSEISCEALSSVPNSQALRLKELDMSCNNLQNSGVKLLSVLLQSPYCILETLSKLHKFHLLVVSLYVWYFSSNFYIIEASEDYKCSLTEKSAKPLFSVLSIQSSSLRELDLSNNDLQDSGVKLLSVGMESPHCKLEALRLCGCKLSENSCEALSSIFSYQFSSLREVDLSNNNLHDSGVTFLSVAMENPNWKLETLRVSGCNLSEKSCKSLSTLLSSQSSNLRELDLSNNNLHDSGVKLIFGGVTHPQCTLETLRLCGCKLSENSCEALSSVFSHHPSSLRVLDLSNNNLHDSGVTFLSVGMDNPNCKLEILRLYQAIFCFLSVQKIIQLKLIIKLLHLMA